MAAAEGFQPSQAGAGGLEGVEVGRAVEPGPSAVTDVGDAGFLAAAVDVFGVVVEGRGEVGGDHGDVGAGVGAVDGDFDEVDGLGRIDLPVGSDDEVDGVQLKGAGFGDEVGGCVARKGGTGEYVAGELEGHVAIRVRDGTRAYDQSGKGRIGMSKT